MPAPVQTEDELSSSQDATMEQKYLITLQRDADLDQFLVRAKAVGCNPPPSAQPIPMSGGEVVVTLGGPTEAYDLLAELPDVRKVSRSSDLHLYRPN